VVSVEGGQSKRLVAFSLCIGVDARKYRFMNSSTDQENQDLETLRLARAGDSRAVEKLFARHREELKRMVRLRLDPRVRGRVDPSDIVQDAYLEAIRKLGDYFRQSSLPFFLWLRLVTGQKLCLVHRQHLGVQARDAGREISLCHGAYPQASSAALAARLLGRLTTPSQAAMKAELRIRIQEALNRLEPMDREVLALRHFEQLSNSEVALILGVKETTACNRYVRALERLRGMLQRLPAGIEGL
jgi:RNA polymerase sigma-70 factor (ECF subfamily)